MHFRPDGQARTGRDVDRNARLHCWSARHPVPGPLREIAMATRMAAVVLLLALAACGLPANVVVLIPDENGTIGKVVVREGASTAELDKPFASVDAGSAGSL